MNEDKCVYSAATLDFLGYRISHNTLSPGPERLAPHLNLPTITDAKSLRRIVDSEQVKAFESLKVELANAAIQVIDENIPFTVETDALDFAKSATLNQEGRPVAFHSFTLQGSEQYYSL
ncbi:Hypothetical predicted protein [Octopus vulgaris]|uniref:Reverse transcriptase/retrotransposon-derived protein RNase H-like domain-containing protein n=1 Tax=Octopus vulgaris TaxID=6645 RepID=A0AA36EVX7_OCTVU|nr:Hypothetical predicted protein [Octopus vulgaris]